MREFRGIQTRSSYLLLAGESALAADIEVRLITADERYGSDDGKNVFEHQSCRVTAFTISAERLAGIAADLAKVASDAMVNAKRYRVEKKA